MNIILNKMALEYILIVFALLVAPLSIPSQVTGFQMNLNPTDVQNNNLLDYGKFHYFDMELLKAIVSRNNGNVLVSPTSVKQVLAMVLEGADGQCADELRNALRLPHDQKQVRNLFGNLLTEFQNDEPGVTFEVANHIFISNKVSPNSQYQENLQKYYHSGIKTVDFSSPGSTANLINDWINKITHGLISALLTADSINPETSIILANALFFKGLWEKSFNEERTRTSCFQHPSHECYKTNMMDTTDTFKYTYVKELDAKAIELPYKGNKYSMLIVLPNKMNGMTRLLRDLPYEYDKLVSKLEYTEVLVSIPRFSFEYSEDIVRNLEEVEITAIFNEQRANLSHIVTGKNNLFISNVFHKAKIEVNEQGTVAAASTGAVVIPLMGSTKPRFRADHPFVFFIRHIELGIILFAGRVSEPELAEPLGGSSQGENKGSQKAYYPEVQPVYMKPQIQRQYTQAQEFKNQEQQYANQQQAFAAQQAQQRVQYVQPPMQAPQSPQYSQAMQQPQRTQYQQNQQGQYSQNTAQSNQPDQYRYQNENDGFIFPKKN